MTPKLIYIADCAIGKNCAQSTHNIEIATELNKLTDLTFYAGIYQNETIPSQLQSIQNKYICSIPRWIPTKLSYYYYEWWLILKVIPLIWQPDITIYIRYRLTALIFWVLIICRKKYIVEYNDHTIEQFKFMAQHSTNWSPLGKKLRINPIAFGLIRGWETLIFKHAYRIRAVTDLLKEYIASLTKSPNHIAVIPNGTNTDRFYPLDKLTARNELNLSPDKIYGIHVGSLTPWDGIDFVIRSLKGVDKMMFLILGGGKKYQEYLTNLAIKTGVRDQIIFLGTKPQEIVQKYIAASDICFLLKTIHSYGLSPIKYYEYMACGRPIIATNVAYINNVIIDQCGYTVDLPINPTKITEILKSITQSNPETLTKMGLNARKAAENKYTWKQRAKEIYKLLPK